MRPDLKIRPDTVVDAFRRLNAITDRGYTFLDNAAQPKKVPFDEMWRVAEARGRKLLALGLERGDRVAMVLAQPDDFVLSFYACLIVGLVPVPMYPPLSFGKLDAYADSAVTILNAAGARLLLTDRQLANVLWQTVPKVPTCKDLVTVDKLDAGRAQDGELAQVRPEDICFLQFTSGSTSAPKGVMVTHGNLIANCWAIAWEGMKLVPYAERAVSWLPLYHDMGLIGMVITPMLAAVETTFIPTLLFVKRPNIWMQTMSAMKAQYSFGPNFAYALATKRVPDADLAKLDLSNVKILGCGAEPIHANTMADFEDKFAACGLPKGSIMPAYGMAEATLAMTFHESGTSIVVAEVDAESFRATGEVSEAADDAVVLNFVSCGKPFRDHDVGIMDTEGRLLPEGREGEIVFRGPSVTAGYWQNAEATAAAYKDGWLYTGDLGFVLDGNVYITGRSKDLIILNGRNHHPQTIEWAVQDVDGVRKGNVVAFSRPGPDSEELVVVVEAKPDAPADCAEKITQAVADQLSLKVSEVILLGPGQLPKTSSGKLQRRKTREQYMRGELGGEGVRTLGATGEKLTVAKHFARSLFGRASHAASKVLGRE